MRCPRVLVALAVAATSLTVAGPATAATCAGGGRCRIGDTGPGGGTVVLALATPTWWGSYIEARPIAKVRGLKWSLKTNDPVYADSLEGSARRKRIEARGIGMGRINTQAIIEQNGPGRYAAAYVDGVVLGGKGDWWLPSLDELDAVYHVVVSGRMRNVVRDAYWTSTEASDRYAWYQMFQDGTQFTDENSIGQVNGVGVKSNKNRIKNAKHGQSGFPVLPYRMMAVRYFGNTSGERPAVFAPGVTQNACTDSGPCAVGDLGPAGGVVFFDAGKTYPWGRYLEAAPASTEAVGLPWHPKATRVRSVHQALPWAKQQPSRVAGKLIGTGAANTRRAVKVYGRGSYAARYAASLVVNGYDDWFLPSHDELTLMYTVMQTADVPLDPLKRSFYWSSSEYDLNNTWTVNFKDGQMFDRLKGTVPTASIKAVRVRAIRAFG